MDVQALPLGLLILLAVSYVWEGNRLLQQYVVPQFTRFHALITQFFVQPTADGYRSTFFYLG
ncbi:hypothetical protein A3SI_11064 [Nitritalea halalkaliphila LW7]|uniref:Uncharacterized protein n=1 Tax=Nitritalea halalkaliphila LW7 TaxID=1189621 RepID=I5C2W3_9BACT|nr:hypothetical protein A3SI_11064 [Nitritalea halalkaliphila LW7]